MLTGHEFDWLLLTVHYVILLQGDRLNLDAPITVIQIVRVLDQRLPARLLTANGSTTLLSTLQKRVQRHVFLIVQEVDDAPFRSRARVLELLAQDPLLHVTVRSLSRALLRFTVSSINLIALILQCWQVVRDYIITAVPQLLLRI